MARPTTFACEKRLRITKVKTHEDLKTAYRLNGGKKSLNALMNEALELGLKTMIEGELPTPTFENALYNATQRIIMNQNRTTAKLLRGMQKITVLQAVFEPMLSTIIQELEFYLKTKGIELDAEFKADIMQNSPLRFEELKTEMINNIMGEPYKDDDSE